MGQQQTGLRWIGEHYPGEAFATITAGGVEARIGYTSLHNLGNALQADPGGDAALAYDFLRLLDEIRGVCAAESSNLSA